MDLKEFGNSPDTPLKALPFSNALDVGIFADDATRLTAEFHL